MSDRLIEEEGTNYTNLCIPLFIIDKTIFTVAQPSEIIVRGEVDNSILKNRMFDQLEELASRVTIDENGDIVEIPEKKRYSILKYHNGLTVVIVSELKSFEQELKDKLEGVGQSQASNELEIDPKFNEGVNLILHIPTEFVGDNNIPSDLLIKIMQDLILLIEDVKKGFIPKPHFILTGSNDKLNTMLSRLFTNGHLTEFTVGDSSSKSIVFSFDELEESVTKPSPLLKAIIDRSRK